MRLETPMGTSGNPKKAKQEEEAAKARKILPPATQDHLRKRGPAKSSLKLIVAEDLAQAVDEAQSAVDKAVALEAPESITIERLRALREAQEEASEATVLINMQAIGRTRWKELEEENPPTPEVDAEHRAATKDPDDPNDLG